MSLFEKEHVKKATHLNHFKEFINELVPLYEEEIPLALIALYPWDDIQQRLSELITTGLRNLKDLDGQPFEAILGQSLKGVYFCLADDARHFSIHASLYYNEKDWAANADYEYLDHEELFMQVSDELVVLGLDSKTIQDLMYLFAAFTLLKTLRTIDDINDIANAGMALGYSDGDELILGHFFDQQFNECIEIIENGTYENPSTAPVEIVNPIAARGDLWDYMKKNLMGFIQEHGLLERFYAFGETEAERISDEFKDQLTLNRCPLCNAIKKTPRARLCLKCGEFTLSVAS